ncbi:hypothetical protein AC062_0743 [Pasteurellaceae bacterium NI1060]|nr:hypothetical protein AC062_0743 [Pasteurellaceae bacterium NI1060]
MLSFFCPFLKKLARYMATGFGKFKGSGAMNKKYDKKMTALCA